jgi:tRNA threonylcarbamoyl adenosine modification protein YeaZ
MLILAFDTTNEQGGVAIHRDLECLASAESQGAANYSVTLFQMVDRLLSEARLKLEDIDLFAVATGPGSFTGIRVGVAAAQGWAQASGRPVCGVSVLEAMIEQARPATDWALPILDARRGEFFLSVFRRALADEAGAGDPGGEPARPADQARYATWAGLDSPPGEESARRLSDAAPEPGLLLRRDSLPSILERFAAGERAGQTITLLARERDAAAQALRTLLPEGPSRWGWQTVRGPLMSAIARLARVAHREGRLQSPAELDAFYVRRSDAEMHWKES